MKKKFVVILAVVFAFSASLAAYEGGSGGDISFGRMCSQTGARGTLPMVLCSRCPDGAGYYKADYVAFCRNGR